MIRDGSQKTINSFALFVDGTINKKMYLRHKNTFSRGFSVDVIYHS